MKDILEYQEIDLAIKRIENEIHNSESRKKAAEMQNLLRTLQDQLIKLDDQAKSINEKFEKIDSNLRAGEAKFKQINDKANTAVGGKAEELVENAKSMQNILQVLEKEATGLYKLANDLAKELEIVMKNAKIAKKNLIYYREQYDNLRKSHENELKSLQVRLQNQEKKVDKKLLSKYQLKQTGRSTKVFVPLVAGRCGGCHMEIAASGMSKLENEKFLECENCGRIIYME